MISGNEAATLRSIAGARGDYDVIKRLLGETRWEIEVDEVDLGYLRVFIPDAKDECYRLIIGYRDPRHPPYALLTFALFPETEEHVAAFNSSFRRVADTLTEYFGAPTASGHRQLSFRAWPYAHERWSLPEGEFTLVQDEFDITEGMDITLWMQPVGTPLEEAARP